MDASLSQFVIPAKTGTTTVQYGYFHVNPSRGWVGPGFRRDDGLGR
jgi:hypothetical protein